MTLEVIDLPGNLLGMTNSQTIQIDINAAGFGWFIDATPEDDVEFAWRNGVYERTTLPGSPPFAQADLLLIVMHELAHVLGDDHDDEGVMQQTLLLGARRICSDGLFPDEATGFGQVCDAPGLTPAMVDDYFAMI